MTAVRVGVVGLGNIGQQHIGRIQSGAVRGATLTAVAARNPPADLNASGATVFNDYRELVDSGLCDAIIVATPTMSHAEIGRYVLERGLHLMLEKPMGLSLAEAESVLAAATKEQVFGVMLNQRIDPVYAHMKSMLSAGLLGPLQRTQWTMTNWFRPEVYFQVSDWRATWRGEGGGLLMNQCIHNLDILQWLCGMPLVVNGFCSFGKYHDIEVEDEATAHFEYANGASGVFVGSTGEAPGVNRLDIVGDLGMLCYDGEVLTHTRNEPGTAQYNRETRDMFGQPQQETTVITVPTATDQHAAMLQNFVDAISSGADLIAPAVQGLDSLALANAILLSAWQGQCVKLPLDSAAYQQALEVRLANSSLRQKADIEVHVDMEKSYR
ncbi:Gfo/Idh/MocA family oxidoreductase [Halieaceae bacterium IMCC14734]|uniref:Gfo/Idh/MocA family oxidoreductase n=1 Tax=Candidatus Litorirhabdus singularis TaxID=2518993 RepID=A0ABT3TKX6_9GAMM|nr:Gfo/Idh/MocA family oxidoreductase [Candidatus Litorirhabdus singularis]MCX2982064.1 Gfo/Idh/MocA family oxidoreductase [Candidatus Litorirhabdus singularis]